MSSTRQWMKFFLDAGIPPDSSAQYAVTFETNRMGLDMLMDLDKEYLRDLNITALGDIISILKHAKSATAKKATDQVLHPDISDIPSTTPPTQPKPLKMSEPTKVSQKIVDPKPRKESFTVSSRLGPQVPVATKSSSSDYNSPSVFPDPVKSVFSRLGDQQSDDSEVETKPSKVKAESYRSPASETSPGSSRQAASGSIFERLGPESDRLMRDPSPQEASVTSTTEIIFTQPARGILKKRGTGDGAGLAKSKSASNIISLKMPALKDLKKKRISFGENEIKTMEPKLDIKSRLGYGRCNSPPPPEISEPILKTEIKKIAVGGGRFEMKKMMKVVNADKTIASELGRTSSAGIFSQEGNEMNSPKMENLTIAVKNDIQSINTDIKPLKIAITNDFKVEEEYKVDKVDLALRAAKLKVALKKSRENELRNDTPSEPKPKKRLAKYVTKADGTVEKEYISYDDPILETLPIKKKKSEGLDNMIKKTEELKMKSLTKSPVMINKDRIAANFQVVRQPSSQAGLYSDSSSSHITLAQKAVLARSKQESFQTLASRAKDVQKRSLSPDVEAGGDQQERGRKPSGAKMDERKPSLKARLDDGNRHSEERNRVQKSPIKSAKDRMGSSDRSTASVMDRVGRKEKSPGYIRDRVGSRERSRSPVSMRHRVGSRDRSPASQDRSRERVGSGGEKKIFSRLGPRD
eukprot:GFUD01008877.1.p1 GENE.GFUD01008877.1~~GFUD01008877.1.p1  ORF type:complete len:694 (-),score=206.87 GFUD01008877.1:123-2204(-)